MGDNTLGPDHIERAMSALRDGWPDMEALFMDGQIALSIKASVRVTYTPG